MMENLVPITEAKARINELVRNAENGERVVLMRHGRAAALIIGITEYEGLLEQIDDLDDRLSVLESVESDPTMRVPFEKVKAELGLLG
ncbi:MAG: type II toxin-antitoxin system prevent-host-death family antitoxin [Acidimicrobiia bacterium]